MKWQAGRDFAPFFVDVKPLCVWGPRLDEDNRRFLRALQPDYFDLLVRLVAEAPDESDEQLMGVAARTFYVHGLETTMALTFAGLQAPQSVFAWMGKYEVRDLTSLIQKVKAASVFKTQCKTPVSSWHDIVSFYLAKIPSPLKAADGRLVEKATLTTWFAGALERLAEEFAMPITLAEYNAAKHGFRGMPGAVTFALRPETSPGVPDESAPPIMISGPKTGISLLQLIPEAGRPWNFRVSDQIRNWDLGQSLQRLQLATMWMTCMKAGLRAHLGDTEPPPKWSWTADATAYTDPWSSIHGTYSARFDPHEFNIPQEATKEWIERVYDEPRHALDAGRNGEDN